MMLLRAIAGGFFAAVATVGVPAGAQDDVDLFDELNDALAPDGETAVVEWRLDQIPEMRLDPADDTLSFDGGAVGADADRNDIVAYSDGHLILPGDVAAALVDGCGTELPGAFLIVCPETALNPAALTDARVFTFGLAAPIAGNQVTHFVAAGNADARPDVPTRPDQPANLLSGDDQFLRIERAADGTWNYGYFLFDRGGFGTFLVDTVALIGPQSGYLISSAPQLDWGTFRIFTDSEQASGIPVGDTTDRFTLFTGTGTLLSQPVPVAPVPVPVPDVAVPDDGAAVAAPAVSTSDGEIGWVPIVLVTTGLVGIGGSVVTLVRTRQPEPTLLSYMDDPVARVVDEEATRLQWTELLAREDEIQQRLLNDYQRIAGIVASNTATFSAALLAFDDGFQRVAWNANWLRGVANETLTAQKVTGGIDLALGVVDAAPALWRFGTWGWTRVFGQGDEVVEVAVDAAGTSGRVTTGATTAVQRGNAVIARSEELTAIANEAGGINIADHFPGATFTRGLDVVFAEAAALGDEAGVAFATTAPQRIAELRGLGMHLSGAVIAVWIDMAEAVARSRGWVKASDDVRSVLTEVTVNVRSFCRGGVVGSMQEMRNALVGFSHLSAQPAFWDTLPTLYTVVGDARSADTTLEVLYHADDVAFLRWVADKLAAGHSLDELPGMWQTLMGPVGNAGEQLATVANIGVGTGTVLSVANGVGDGLRVVDLFSNPATVTSVLPDGVTYLSQFGILRPTVLGFEAGDSAPLTFLFNGLNGVGGFATWLTGFRGSIEGGLLYDDVREELQPTFTTMAGAALDMVNVLQVVSERVAGDSIDIQDRNALRSVLGDMEACVGSSGPLQDELGPALDDRRRHITTKLAQLDAVQSTLVTAAQGLPAIAAVLDDAVSSGRGSIEWADPALSKGFTVAGTALGLLAGGVLRPPVPVDETTRGPEVFDKAVPGNYMERSSDDPPEPGDTSNDDFFEQVNRAVPNSTD